jgi:hypothetical protein
MPRYFFHIFENGETTLDDTGLEFDTDEQVQFEAMRVLPEIARDEVPADGDRQAFTVLATDEAGHPVYTATLTFAGLWLKLNS